MTSNKEEKIGQSILNAGRKMLKHKGKEILKGNKRKNTKEGVDTGEKYRLFFRIDNEAWN